MKMNRKRLLGLAGCAGLAASVSAFGQVSISSSIPGTFNDISGSSAPVVTGDDQIAAVSVSAAAANAIFPAGSLSVCTNGHAGYGNDASFTNQAIPNPTFYGGGRAAAVYWDDLITNQGGAGVYAQEVTENGNQVLVVEWVRMDHYSSSPNNATFELKIYGGASGPMGSYAQYLYQTTAFGDGNDNGTSATVGYQFNGVVGEQYSMDTAGSIPDGLVLTLAPGTGGACCLPDGSCLVLSSSNCSNVSGVYRGDNTTCATANCPTGACCTSLGCVITAPAGCANQGGTYHGDGSTCASAGCPQLWQEQGDAGDLPATAQFVTGSGPLPGIAGNNDASDTDMYAINITDAASFSASTGNSATTWDTMLFLFDSTGHGITANDDAVGLQSALSSQFVPGNGLYYLAITHFFRAPQNASAQTLWNSYTPENRPDGPGAADAVAAWTGNTAAGGPYIIALTGASYVDTSTVGACCLPDGTCGLNTSSGCTAASGVYRGNGSVCANANCPQPPTGACCLDSGCSTLNQFQCAAQHGLYHGDNTSCASFNCPANVIVNGGFETGDFTGWTQFGDTSFDFVDGFIPHSGQFQGTFGSEDPAGSGIQQTITANAGDHIHVEFWLLEEEGFTPNSATVTLGSTTLLSLIDDTTTTDYTFFSYDTVATQANPVLTFNFYNENLYWDLDDVKAFNNGSGGQQSCYANCDHSTAIPFLNVNDFICFQTKFAAGDSYANCDLSTTPPILNVNDFICFQTKFAGGCSAP